MAWPSLSMAGVAVAGVCALGLNPTIGAGVELTAAPNAYFVRGTNIGNSKPIPEYLAWADGVLTTTVGAHGGPVNAPYSGGFWPLSKGLLADPKYDNAIDEGLRSLTDTIAAGGDADNPVIIYGYSQGAVVATEYLRAHPDAGNTYVLIGNPNRPDGGILQRFNGLHIPVIDISFTGATPTDGDRVIDIAYRYDGWADFPKYPLNLVSTANALLGIYFLHGRSDLNVNAETLADAEVSTHGNTTYYLLNSERIPLLMPFDGWVPDPVLDSVEPGLRHIVELGYDRGDYGVPTQAELLPGLGDPAPAAVASPEVEPDSEAAEPLSSESESESESEEPDDKPLRSVRASRAEAAAAKQAERDKDRDRDSEDVEADEPDDNADRDTSENSENDSEKKTAEKNDTEKADSPAA